MAWTHAYPFEFFFFNEWLLRYRYCTDISTRDFPTETSQKICHPLLLKLVEKKITD